MSCILGFVAVLNSMHQLSLAGYSSFSGDEYKGEGGDPGSPWKDCDSLEEKEADGFGHSGFNPRILAEIQDQSF